MSIQNYIDIAMKNKDQNTKNSESQLEKANAALVALAHNVTTEDRRDAPASVFTVVQYLKGRGKELGTAIKLLEFFKERIAKRERFLNSASAA